METRRQLLKSASILAAAAAVAIPTKPLAAKPADECELYANKLCDSLARKFGGKWQFQLTAGQDAMLVCKNL